VQAAEAVTRTKLQIGGLRSRRSVLSKKAEMAEAGLFVGFGLPVRGRERQAVKVFGEALEYYARLQQQGEIDSFETVFLEPHGGDLNGFHPRARRCGQAVKHPDQ
jgi:hypothetical protein